RGAARLPIAVDLLFQLDALRRGDSERTSRVGGDKGIDPTPGPAKPAARVRNPRQELGRRSVIFGPHGAEGYGAECLRRELPDIVCRFGVHSVDGGQGIGDALDDATRTFGERARGHVALHAAVQTEIGLKHRANRGFGSELVIAETYS